MKAAIFQIPQRKVKYKVTLCIGLHLKTGAWIQVPTVAVTIFQTWTYQATKCDH